MKSPRAAKAKPGRPAKSNKTPDAKDLILRSALELFAKQGYARTSNRDISAASGKNAAMIYYYFEDKEALFLAALQHVTSEALEHSRQLKQASAAPDELLKSWFASHRSLRDEIKFMIKVMIDYSSQAERSRTVDALIDDFYSEEISEILIKSIQAGIEFGLFNNVDAERIARGVSTHLDGIIVASIVRRDFDYLVALEELETQLFEQLGYGAR